MIALKVTKNKDFKFWIEYRVSSNYLIFEYLCYMCCYVVPMNC